MERGRARLIVMVSAVSLLGGCGTGMRSERASGRPPERATMAAPERSGAATGSRPGPADPRAARTLAIDPSLIDRIITPADFFAHQPELMYLAMQDDPALLSRLMRLVPMATRDDCTCCAGQPGDVAAVIVSAALAADPTLAVLADVPPTDRDAIIRYLDAVEATDWTPEVRAGILARFPGSD